MRLYSKKHREHSSRINIASLIDVFFLLIVFFMVISHVSPRYTDLDLPQADTGVEKQNDELKKIVFDVDKQGVMRYLGRVTTIDSAEKMLQQEVAAGCVEILIRGDRNAEWSKIAGLMRLCSSKGINHVRVATAGNSKNKN